MTNYEDQYRYNKEPVKEIDGIAYIDVPYLIKLLRDMQSGRYANADCGKEYICIENIIQCIETQTSFLTGNYWIGSNSNDT